MTVATPIGSANPAPATRPDRVGVLLVNLGTPDTADARGVRVYLKEFLSDPRVIEDQGLRWKLILNGIILRVRPGRRPRGLSRRSPTTTTSWSIGRCATATRRSVRASQP